jgi:hypothetical protein
MTSSGIDPAVNLSAPTEVSSGPPAWCSARNPLIAGPTWLVGYALGRTVRLSRAALHLLLRDGSWLDLSARPAWTELSDELSRAVAGRTGPANWPRTG